MPYVATIHQPGCLPDSTEPAPIFETAQEAWDYLSTEYQRDDETAWEPSDPSDSDGPHSLTKYALWLEEYARSTIPVLDSVLGDDGYFYTVEWTDGDTTTTDQDETGLSNHPLHNGVIGMGHSCEYRD